MKDLIVVAACSQIEHAFRGLLTRSPSLQIRHIDCDIYVHPNKDPGCLCEGHDYLRSQAGRYAHALVVFDREGSGGHGSSEELEAEVEANLAASGWEGRSAAVVIEPELEIWVWSDSPVVDQVCGWGGRIPRMRQWMQDQGVTFDARGKPLEPKSALDAVLKHARKIRSSALFRQLAERVSLERCEDRAFGKVKAQLRSWFGVNPPDDDSSRPAH